MNTSIERKKQMQEYKSVEVKTSEGKEFKEHNRKYDMNSADNVI